MSSDPIFRLAQQRAITDSADVEAQLAIAQGCRPILSLLVKARDKASQALTALAFIDVHDWKAIQSLQNEVRRYDDMVIYIKEIIADGFAADAEIRDEDRDEFIDLLASTPDGQYDAEQLGLIDPVPHDA